MRRFWASLLFGLVATVASAWVERGGQPREVGGEGFCGLEATAPCLVETFGGGLPLVYLVNNPEISVPTALAFVEDDFHAAPFAADVAFWTMLAAGAMTWRSRRRGAASASAGP